MQILGSACLLSNSNTVSAAFAKPKVPLIPAYIPAQTKTSLAMLCLSQLHAHCVPNQRFSTFIFLCGGVEGAKMPPRHVKTLQMSHCLRILGIKCVNVVNNTREHSHGYMDHSKKKK